MSNTEPTQLGGAAAIYDALTGSPHGLAGAVDYSDAWFTVCAALSEADPQWTTFGNTGAQAAANFIRHLATFQQHSA
jgi:hypothetical protein